MRLSKCYYQSKRKLNPDFNPLASSTFGKKRKKCDLIMWPQRVKLKQKYYNKNQSHVKKVGHTSLLMILKNNYLFKKCWSGPIKNVRIFIYKVVSFKKNKEKHLEISLFYNCVPKILMLWSAVFENDLQFWKIKISKKWKKYLEMSSFYTCASKITIICMLPEI